MRRIVPSLVLLLLVSAPFLGTVRAEDKIRPIQLGLVNPIQIFPETDTIHGVRIDLIYGVNQDVVGFDLGVVGVTHGEGKGVFWNLVGIVENDFTGWQKGLMSICNGTCLGMQSGIANKSAVGGGLQFGVVNISDDYEGLQLGIVNFTDRMNGLQIGLINIIQSKEKLSFFPIVNWSFQ